VNPAWGLKIEGGYFDEERHLYRDERGTPVLSVTQIFDCLGFSDFSSIAPDVLNWKREYGNGVHRAIELLVSKDLDWDSCDERIIPTVIGVEQRLEQMGYVSQACEERRIHNLFGMHYGGTLDHRGTCIHQGVERPCIIDIKTGSKESPSWKWQIAAYTVGLERPAKGWLGIVLQVNADGRVVPHYYDVYTGLKEFQCLLSAAILKVNAGLVKFGNATAG
jgi:hypothetical protein